MSELTRPVRVLSFDGGGIRGLITATWLAELERRLDRPLGSCVDFVAGTSTGAILAAAVALRIPMATVAMMFKERGSEIFPRGARGLWDRATRLLEHGISQPRYSGAGLDQVLRETLRLPDWSQALSFGAMTGGPGMLITSYDTVSREAVVMKSWDQRYAHLPLWEVVRASCSAPAYFPAKEMTITGRDRALIDGGVVANNPAAAILATVTQRLNAETRGRTDGDILVASFGAGQLCRPISAESAREWGALEWAIPIIDVLFDGTADATDYLLASIVPEHLYFRFQVELRTGYDDLDNASRTNLEQLQALARSYLDGPGGVRLGELAGRLLQPGTKGAMQAVGASASS